jgi:hypothetical protein
MAARLPHVLILSGERARWIANRVPLLAQLNQPVFL